MKQRRVTPRALDEEVVDVVGAFGEGGVTHRDERQL